MTRRSSIALLLLTVVAGLSILAFGRNSPAKVDSMQVVTIPDRGRAAEFVLKNNSSQRSGFYFYRQQWFDGHWVPKTITSYQPADEICHVSPGSQVTVTLRIPDSSGRFRFHILYGRPPPIHQRLAEWVRKSLGLRANGLHGRTGMIIADSINVPPA